jgi:hypothetical protein
MPMTCPRWLPVAPLLFVLWAALAPACGGRGSRGDESQPDGGFDARTQDSGMDAAVDSDAGVNPGKDAAADPGGDAAVDPGRDAAIEPSKDASVADAASDAAAPGPTLDDCFAHLPSPVGTQMVATKSSSDGRLRLRIALDTMDMFGTSGTYPWALLRLGIERNGAVTCITDAAKLTYRGSHHNCDDKASAVAGMMAFDLTAPDRAMTSLTMRDSGAVVEDSVLLEDTTCTMSPSFGPVECRSGGPC